MQCWNLNCLYHFGITRLLVPTTNPPPNSGSQFHLTLYSKIPPLLHLNVSPPPTSHSHSLSLSPATHAFRHTHRVMLWGSNSIPTIFSFLSFYHFYSASLPLRSSYNSNSSFASLYTSCIYVHISVFFFSSFSNSNLHNSIS